ncbi:MAG: hypothetical protein LBP52_02445 [Burkholderiaceae bacterium]|jgi:hypothetical protein|nr:hypothetical protein [Burkholderiaceae bacterium]
MNMPIGWRAASSAGLCAIALLGAMAAFAQAVPANTQRPPDWPERASRASALQREKPRAVATAGVVTLFTEGPPNIVIANATVIGVDDDDGFGNDTVCLEAFDDFSTLVATQCYTVAVGATATLAFALTWNGPIGSVDPGIGLYLMDENTHAILGYVNPLTPAMTPAPFNVMAAPPAAVPALRRAALPLLLALLTLLAVWQNRLWRRGDPSAKHPARGGGQ